METTNKHDCRVSQLKDLLEPGSPALYRWNRDHDREETDAMRLGSATHCAVLEPSDYAKKFAVWVGGRRAGKEWEAFQASVAANKQTCLTAEQDQEAKAISEAVRANKEAMALMVEGKPESELTWKHPRTGIVIGGRLDWLGRSTIFDLKTARAIDPRRFVMACVEGGYFLQLALYSDMAAANGFGAPPVSIIAVENHAPYDCCVYRLDERHLSIGREQYEQALDLLVECKRTNTWPGIAPEGVRELPVPAWLEQKLFQPEDLIAA